MSNPEQAVIDAIDGLDLAYLVQLVKWQLEEGSPTAKRSPSLVSRSTPSNRTEES